MRPHAFLFSVLLLLACTTCLTSAQSNITTNSYATASFPRLENPILQDHMDRFLEIVNSNGTDMYNQSEYEERFDIFFFQEIPLETVESVIVDLQQIANAWKILDIAVQQASAAVLLIVPDQDASPDDEPVIFAVSISIDSTDGRIDGFTIQDAAPSLEVEPETMQDAVTQLSEMGHPFHYLVAHVTENNECQALAGSEYEKPAPLGSMFKLWVLAAVVDAVQDGSITWDQLVTVTEEAKSLPSGIVQDDRVGTNRPVRELAKLMISISDNTATDLLIGLVGREKVEQALVDYGHHYPSLNIPFLKTKELFILKLDGASGDGQPGPLGLQYIGADEAEQREILAGLENTTIADFDINLAAWVSPIAIEDLEWFGSPIDLCNVMARLVTNSEDAASILDINPGVPDEILRNNTWSYIGFKGGAEPGVFGLSWYLVPSNSTTDVGHRFVTGTLWDPTDLIDTTKGSLLLGALRDLSLFEDTEAIDSSTEDESLSTSNSGEPGSNPSSAAGSTLMNLLSWRCALFLFCVLTIGFV